MNNVTSFPLGAVEVTGLIDLVAQLRDVLTAGSTDDPALARLTPTAYPDDADAAREFRRLTEGDITARRVADADVMAAALAAIAPSGEVDPATELALELSAAEVGSWMRTLAAMRLVIATRLGIADDGEYDRDDPAYGIYEWLAYRLETLIEATDA